MTRPASARRSLRRGIATAMAAVAVLQFGVARSNPGDIFQTNAPTSGADAPHAADIKDGDVSVATSTGAVQYSYPIAVPPGRLGAQPALSLSYASQAPLFGTNLGAGWTLSGVPRIEEDTSQGRLRTHSGEVEAQQGAVLKKVDDRFVSSLAGGRPLIAVTTDPAAPNVFANYRAQNDSSFARYQRMDNTQPYRWRVLTTDGTSLYFGDSDHAPGCPISDGFAPLTRQVDRFGNEVSFEWAMSSGECMLSRITWGQNAVAGLPSFAEVEINYGCGSFATAET